MSVTSEICKSFNSHASEYEQVAKVQREIGDRLFDRLQLLNIKPRYILDLGCGPGNYSQRLKKYYPKAQIIGFDLAYQMLQQAKNKQSWRNKWNVVNGDMAAMPFATGLFDLVFANQVIHWSVSLSEVMAELSRVMKPGACLMFSTLGPDTFGELRQSWSAIDPHAHTNDFLDMHHVGDVLLAERFLDPVVDMEFLTAHYPTLSKLLQDLKSQGVRNIHSNRNSGLTGRHSWHRFEQVFSACCTEQGKYPLTYEVIYGHAWKGEQRRTDKGIETMISVSQLRTPTKN